MAGGAGDRPRGAERSIGEEARTEGGDSRVVGPAIGGIGERLLRIGRKHCFLKEFPLVRIEDPADERLLRVGRRRLTAQARKGVVGPVKEACGRWVRFHGKYLHGPRIDEDVGRELGGSDLKAGKHPRFARSGRHVGEDGNARNFAGEPRCVLGGGGMVVSVAKEHVDDTKCVCAGSERLLAALEAVGAGPRCPDAEDEQARKAAIPKECEGRLCAVRRAKGYIRKSLPHGKAVGPHGKRWRTGHFRGRIGAPIGAAHRRRALFFAAGERKNGGKTDDSNNRTDARKIHG